MNATDSQEYEVVCHVCGEVKTIRAVLLDGRTAQCSDGKARLMSACSLPTHTREEISKAYERVVQDADYRVTVKGTEQAPEITEFQKKVLYSMPDEWLSISCTTDIVYPEAITKRVHGLCRAAVRDALYALYEKGYVIRKACSGPCHCGGYYKVFDAVDRTSIRTGDLWTF